MNRREFSGAIALGGLASFVPVAHAAPDADYAGPFSRQTVVAMAEELAGKAYAPPPALPEALQTLSYDQYRDIRFRPESAFWLGQDRGFVVDLLHAGFVYKSAVDIHLVEDGQARRLAYSPSLFDFGPLVESAPGEDQALFSGFRIRAHINTKEYWDEIAAFQGASYFRGVGEELVYGLSARGLAVDTAEPKGEEFPAFRSFWIERPESAAGVITVHALLDSKSVTGAYRFRIVPGHATRMEVDVTLFARREVKFLGMAPLTSMFLFGAIDRGRFDDFRPAVHDSDGLVMRRSNGEWLWRPLGNPKALQISAFMDSNPSLFGLLQRSRRFEDFEDLEARYELRPSVWIEPKADWGEGQVVLVEIPSDRETNDNVVAFWRPKEPLAKRQSLSFGYWLHWGRTISERRLARVRQSRAGQSLASERRLFVLEFAQPAFGTPLGEDVRSHVAASKGVIKNLVGGLNPVAGGYRVSFELEPGNAELSELRVVLARGSDAVSETWLYRWTRQ